MTSLHFLNPKVTETYSKKLNTEYTNNHQSISTFMTFLSDIPFAVMHVLALIHT